MLPISELARSTLPGADAAAIVAGERGKQVITLLSLLSLLPLLNAILMIGARILFGMGRDRLVSARLTSVNAGGTPAAATVVTTAVAVLLIASGTFQQLIALASVFLAANYTMSCLALVVLRRREPDNMGGAPEPRGTVPCFPMMHQGLERWRKGPRLMDGGLGQQDGA